MALIEITAMAKTFQVGDETIYALADATFEIQEGEFVALTGPSGSGKTTLMNILGLLDVPSAGSYRLDQRETKDLGDDERSMLRNQKIGFVFQTFNLLSRATALRNVEMPLVYSASYDRSYSKARIREMATESLRRVGLESRMAHRPNELSGGQRQRVAIARALVNHPKILFADEPTGNLDSRTGEDILKLFEELNRDGVTIVMVTHDPTIADRARRTLVMRDGKILTDQASGALHASP